MGGGDEDLFGPWETHYNWRRMLGYDLRRWMWLDSRLGHWGCRWEYGRSKKVAREMLHRAYDAPTGHEYYCDAQPCICGAWKN